MTELDKQEFEIKKGMHKINGGDEDSFAWAILREQIKSAKRLFILCALMCSISVLSTGVTAYILTQYGFSEQVITQDGQGTNIVGDGNEVVNGTEDSN